MEIWARCGECDRWFYCEGGADPALPSPTCPVCGADPTDIVNRAARPEAPDAIAGMG